LLAQAASRVLGKSQGVALNQKDFDTFKPQQQDIDDVEEYEEEEEQ
jgi:hypothetical protein